MKNSAMLTSVNVDTAMYFALLLMLQLTGYVCPFLKANQIKNVAD